MNYTQRFIAVVLAAGLFTGSASADFKITIPDVEVTSDGVNPTTGSFPILLEVDGAGAPGVSAPISSYNFLLNVTGVSGGITTVNSLTGSAGDLFSSVPSFPFSFGNPFSFGVDPLGFSEGASTSVQPTAPAPSTLNTPIVMANIAFEIPAGQVGSFTVDVVPNTLEIYDDTAPVASEYQGVSFTGGTITAVPEPSAFLMLGLIGGVAVFRNKLKRRFACLFPAK